MYPRTSTWFLKYGEAKECIEQNINGVVILGGRNAGYFLIFCVLNSEEWTSVTSIIKYTYV